MAHFNFQQAIAFAIVAVAFWAVGRRLWNQILAFRRRPPRRKSVGTKKPMPPSSASPLIQVQLKPPAHLKRPPSEQ